MVVLNGFVKIHRKLLNWGWYQDNVVKGVFLHLLLTASFRESQWQGRTIQPGQVVTSYGRLAEDLGFGVRRIRTALDKLKSTGELTSEATNKYQLITIVNWEDYQCYDDEETELVTNNASVNRQSTDNQPTINRQHRKNVKNKRIKENKKTRAREESFYFDPSDNFALDGTSGEAREVDGGKRPGKVKDPYWGLSYDDEEEDDE